MYTQSFADSPWSYHIRWLFMCKWGGLSVFQAFALYPLLLKDKHRKWTNSELIPEGWPVPLSGLQASLMELQRIHVFCFVVLRVQAPLGIHGFHETAPWEICSGSHWFSMYSFQDGGWEGKIVSGQIIMKSSMADLQREKLPGIAFWWKLFPLWNMLLESKFEIS